MTKRSKTTRNFTAINNTQLRRKKSDTHNPKALLHSHRSGNAGGAHSDHGNDASEQPGAGRAGLHLHLVPQ